MADDKKKFPIKEAFQHISNTVATSAENTHTSQDHADSLQPQAQTQQATTTIETNPEAVSNDKVGHLNQMAKEIRSIRQKFPELKQLLQVLTDIRTLTPNNAQQQLPPHPKNIKSVSDEGIQNFCYSDLPAMETSYVDPIDTNPRRRFTAPGRIETVKYDPLSTKTRFKFIKEKYGYDTYKLYQLYENTTIKLVRLHYDLYYLQQCRWNNIIPKGGERKMTAFSSLW
ncbi:unnamed protein product [Adineta steineri]|uniref:Uncharacterized protein n=1 Tax=Adineta steineri TaxID=433720 RepID=A0A815TRU6_9BILA|nr:unnamed protein product [Adineta steineri]CAF4149986.1 unnamed protein product [Adineta steineri]